MRCTAPENCGQQPKRNANGASKAAGARLPPEVGEEQRHNARSDGRTKTIAGPTIVYGHGRDRDANTITLCGRGCSNCGVGQYDDIAPNSPADRVSCSLLHAMTACTLGQAEQCCLCLCPSGAARRASPADGATAAADAAVRRKKSALRNWRVA